MSKIVYSCSVGDGAWQVPLWGSPNDKFWYIHNLRTGVFKKIGRIGARKANYYMKAVDEARRRNAEEAEEERLLQEQLAAIKW